MVNQGTYLVQSGDTLGKIAKQHGYTVEALAAHNRIADVNRIRAGQLLRLPPKPAFQDRKPDQDDADALATVLLEFRDAANKPIQDMKVILDGVVGLFEAVTDHLGRLPPVAVAEDARHITVKVEKKTGGQKEVAKIAAPKSSAHVLLHSPKVKAQATLRRHEGVPTEPTNRKIIPLGEQQSVRSPAGHPVEKIGLECPNKENLKLLANFKYRDIVIRAAKRAGLIPQAVAAIMRAEAAKISDFVSVPVYDKKTKKPIIGKNGKPKTERIPNPRGGEWDARSANPRSSARGMTQFLDGTWVAMAMTDDTYLNQKVKELGWLTKTVIEVPPKKGKSSKPTQKVVPAFKLDATKLEARQPLSKFLISKKNISSRAHSPHKNLQELLDMRFDPEASIQTAVDYAIQNLQALETKGYAINKLTDGEKAKIAYLAHHLGQGDAKRFIEYEINEERAEELLNAQKGEKAAAGLADENDGSYIEAHRNWLSEFVDSNIRVGVEACNPAGLVAARPLLIIADALRNKDKK